MTVKILDAQLRDAYFHRLLGNMINKYIGTEGTTRFPEVLLKGFNVSFSDVEAKTYSTLMDPQVKAVYTSMVDVVNAGVESYIEKHGYNVEVPEGTPTKKAYQIAVEEIEDEFNDNDSSELTGIKPDDETDPVGGNVSSIMKAMIDDLADRTSQDAKRVAETIIQMEREKQNQLKAEDSENEAEDMIDSEDMTEEDADDIDELDAEDPNAKDEENPLEDEEIEEEVKEDGKKDKKEKESKEDDSKEEETETKEEDENNPFSALESVLDNGPALEAVEPGMEDLAKVITLLSKKFLIKAAVTTATAAGVSYLMDKAVKHFSTEKMTAEEVNELASKLENEAQYLHDEMRKLSETNETAKKLMAHYKWNFDVTPKFEKEMVDKKRFVGKAIIVKIDNPTYDKPENITPEEQKEFQKLVDNLFLPYIKKGFAYAADKRSTALYLANAKYIIQTTEAAIESEIATEGIKEIWQGIKKGLGVARDLMAPAVKMSKAQLEELKRVSKDKEREVQDKLLAVAKEAKIDGLEVVKDEGTWDVRDKFLNNYLVTLKIKTNGNHDKNALKELFDKMDAVCTELNKDSATLNHVSKAKFYRGLVNMSEDAISEFQYGITSTRKVVIVEDATESYFIVDKVNGKPVYGTESTGNDIPENYKLYNLGLFMRNLREKSYKDMKESFESSPMNGYVYAGYVTESEAPVMLDGMLGFRAVEINKNELDTSENFVVETAKLALKSARKFATESVNKAELDPTNIGFKITKENGIYTGYVTYKCDGLESIDSLCDNYGIESFESDLMKSKFIESIENYGIESQEDPSEKLFREMKVNYAKLKVAGYNAYAAESLIYDVYRRIQSAYKISALESLETRLSSDSRLNTLKMRNNKLSYDKLRNIYDSVGQEVLNIKYSKKLACESANVAYEPNFGLVFSFEKAEPTEAIAKLIQRSKSFNGIESLVLRYENGTSKVVLPIDLHTEACEGFSNVAKALRNYKEGLEMAKLGSVAEVAIESIDGIKSNPFANIREGQILKAATAYTTTMMEESLKEKFNRYGMESTEFKQAQERYKETTKKLAYAIATTATVLSRLGLEYDLSMIRDPELFMNI